MDLECDPDLLLKKTTDRQEVLGEKSQKVVALIDGLVDFAFPFIPAVKSDLVDPRVEIIILQRLEKFFGGFGILSRVAYEYLFLFFEHPASIM